MKSFISLVAALALAGCTAIEYKSVAVDSPSPIDEKGLVKCPKELRHDKICTARILADQLATPTGIQVAEKGETFCIEVLPHQVWFDADRRNTPPHGDEGNWIMKIGTKRHPEAGYFSLMVDVQAKPPAIQSKSAKQVGDSPGWTYTADSVGALVLYPNDAIGSTGEPEYYYKNNSGYIWVTIKRCAAKRLQFTNSSP
jgi:hypothetical protein